jgi:hypothetical protein
MEDQVKQLLLLKKLPALPEELLNLAGGRIQKALGHKQEVIMLCLL